MSMVAPDKRMANRGKARRILAILACLPIAVYILLLGASHAYFSGGPGSRDGRDLSPFWDKPAASYLIHSINLPGVRNPGPIRVERLSAGHALRNAIFVFSTVALIALFSLLGVVGGIIATLVGIFTGKWDVFGVGCLCTVLAPLAILASGLFALVMWIEFLLQPCTPGYFVLWLVLGLPLAAGGVAGGTAPSVKVIVIIKQ